MEVNYYSWMAEQFITLHHVQGIAKTNLNGIVRFVITLDDYNTIFIDPIDLISVEREDF